MTRTLILFLALALGACAIPVKLVESDLREHIIGSWVYRENDPPMNFRWWLIFETGGAGKFGNSGGCLASEGNGSWTLSGNVVHIEVRDGDNFLAHMDSSFEILTITSRRLKLREITHGKTYVFNREKL